MSAPLTLTLRELSEEALALDDLLAMDDGEFTPEAEALAVGLAEQLAAKADGFGAYLRELEAQDDALAAEAARIAARKKAIAGRAARLKVYGLMALQRMERPKVAGTLFTLAVQNNPPSVQVSVGVEALPEQFVRVIPEQREADKVALKEALKRGEVIEGVALVVTQSLRVR